MIRTRIGWCGRLIQTTIIMISLEQSRGIIFQRRAVLFVSAGDLTTCPAQYSLMQRPSIRSHALVRVGRQLQPEIHKSVQSIIVKPWYLLILLLFTLKSYDCCTRCELQKKHNQREAGTMIIKVWSWVITEDLQQLRSWHHILQTLQSLPENPLSPAHIPAHWHVNKGSHTGKFKYVIISLHNGKTAQEQASEIVTLNFEKSEEHDYKMKYLYNSSCRTDWQRA